MSEKENIEPRDPDQPTEPEEQSQPVLGFDDALADVRQSLIEDEVEEQAKDPGFLGRLKKRIKTKKKPESADEQIQLDTIELLADDELEEASQALIAMLDSEQEMVQDDAEEEPLEDETPEPVAESVPEEQPAPVATAEFQPEPPAPEPAGPDTKAEKNAPSTDIQEIRDVALEDYDETQDAKPEKSAFEKASGSLTSFFTGFTRSEKMIIAGMFFVAISIAIFYGAFYLGRSTAPAPAASEPTQDILKPRPVSVSLPGGWNFRLTTGLVIDGKWEPTGPEWLKGTEICRWVSLPWSTQLEAVIRTINAGDVITLNMSNADKLTYFVSSLTQINADEMDKLPSNEPCLLIILTKPKESNRWVLEAVPE